MKQLLVLGNATVATVDAADRVLVAHDVLVEGDCITAVVPHVPDAYPDTHRIDCSGMLVVPGFVNAHTHVGTGLFRGLVEDVPAQFWAKGYAVPGAERAGAREYALSAAASCSELLLNGVTCIADRYSWMDAIAPAIEASGIRAIVGSSLSDASRPADWAAADALLERYGTAAAGSRLTAAIAPHALDTCSDELLRESAGRSERAGCPVFLHVAQSRTEVEALHRRGYSGALECLVNNGLAGPHVVASHAIFLDEAEIEMWPTHQIAIAHCPASNIKIEARTIALARFAGKVPVGLGTDWAVTNNSMDLLAEARLACLIGKLTAHDPQVLSARQMLRMLTIEGARCLGLDRWIGSIEAGKKADLAVFQLDRPEATPAHDVVANLIHSMNVRSIEHVFVDGVQLVAHGKPLGWSTSAQPLLS